MAKIVCLVPRLEMMEQARTILEEMKIDNVDVYYREASEAIEWAHGIVKEDVDIIIARGLQATHIKNLLTIPVVEMRLTGQEMGLLIKRAKSMLPMEHPIIGIVGYENQFCDMNYFNQIFDIDLRTYFVKDEQAGLEQLMERAREAVASGVDLIIGGDAATGEAEKQGIPNVFISATGDSFREAMRAARRMAYAIDQEKSNTEEMKTLLDNAFGVMAKLDRSGNIIIINHVAQSLLGWRKEEVVGRHVTRVTDAIDPNTLQDVLVYGQEVYSKYIYINNVAMVANLSPIKSGETVTGAIFSSQEVKLLEDMGTAARKELYRMGRVAKVSFGSMEEPSATARKTVAMARQYARSDAPVFIYSEPGNGQSIYAQAIHNAGERKKGPYVAVNCAQDVETGQLAMLFGGTGSEQNPLGLLGHAHGGTVFLDEVDRLTSPCQHRLMALMKDKVVWSGDQRPTPIDVRVIASSSDDLYKLAEERKFSQELFYLLNNLYLEIPPLRQRPEDLQHWIDRYIKRFARQYKRYIVLTNGAKDQLNRYPWQGNLTQLASFCERLVLTTHHRSADENDIQHLYMEMYPITVSPRMLEGKVVYKDPEAALIAGLLEKHNGSRSAVAREMKISTTTLWRKIKKHGVMNKFDI